MIYMKKNAAAIIAAASGFMQVGIEYGGVYMMDQRIPWAIMARATFMKPATLAPFT